MPNLNCPECVKRPKHTPAPTKLSCAKLPDSFSMLARMYQTFFLWKRNTHSSSALSIKNRVFPPMLCVEVFFFWRIYLRKATAAWRANEKKGKFER